MLNVSKVLDDIIRTEGGYVNHPNDKGGPTKYGVTQRTLGKHLGREATIDDVKSLTIAVAKEIYLADYFYHPRIHTLPELLQPQLLDIAINSGPPRAIEMLQKVLNMAGYECSVDRVVGPATRAHTEKAVAEMGPYLVNALSEYREQFYRSLVANNPTQAVFLKGWLARARSFRVEI